MSTYFIKKLREFMRGQASPRDLEGVDDSVTVKRFNQNMPAQSDLAFEFKDFDQVLKAIGLKEDDLSFYYSVKNPYYSHELFDHHTSEDDFSQGYGAWNYFDSENQKKLEKIAKIILPTNFDLNSFTFKEEFARKLKNTFKKSFEEICNDYAIERNNELITSAEKYIDDEINDVLDETDFRLSGDRVITTAANLFGWYVKMNLLHESPKKVILESLKSIDKDMGYFYENLYEISNDKNFDEEGFNITVSKTLDEIIDKLYDEDENPRLADYLKMSERILSKFQFNKWYNLPKDRTKTVDFSIQSLEPETNKIVVALRKGLKRTQLKLTEQNFYNLLYQPELFQFGELHNL